MGNPALASVDVPDVLTGFAIPCRKEKTGQSLLGWPVDLALQIGGGVFRIFRAR
jgi:hypothetical protein